MVTITGTTFIPGFTIVVMFWRGGRCCCQLHLLHARAPRRARLTRPARSACAPASVGGQQSADTPADDYVCTSATAHHPGPESRAGTGGHVGHDHRGVRLTWTPGATVVDFGSYRATQVHLFEHHAMHCRRPTQRAQHVRVRGLDREHPPDLKSEEWLWAYEPDLEAADEISPNRGPARGGTLVTFTGNDFEMENYQVAVLFGATDRPVSGSPRRSDASSKSQCTAIAPPGPAP